MYCLSTHDVTHMRKRTRLCNIWGWWFLLALFPVAQLPAQSKFLWVIVTREPQHCVLHSDYGDSVTPGLHDLIISPVCDITYIRKSTRPSPTCTASQGYTQKRNQASSQPWMKPLVTSIHPHAHTGEQLFWVERWQYTVVSFCRSFMRQSGGHRVYQVVWSFYVLTTIALHIHTLMC